MTPFRKFVFCTTDFYLVNGIPEWIFLLHGCRTNQINYTIQRAARSNHILELFCYVLIFLIFWIFWISFSHGMEFQNGFPLAQIWSLWRSKRTPNMSCIGNCIKKLWLRSANLYFGQRIFIWRTEFQNGFSFLYGCRTNQINYTLQRAARSNHFLVLFCYVLIFWIFWIFWILFSHRMEFQNGFSFGTNLKLVNVSTDTKDELHR